MSNAKRRARRAQEQAAIEALYWLAEVSGEPTTDMMDSAVQDYGRFFRCPRCGGCGTDPEQPNQSWPPQEPPDPCGLCNGYGTVGPQGRIPPWDEDILKARDEQQAEWAKEFEIATEYDR